MCHGLEFVAQALRDWIAAMRATTAHIEPANPWEDGYCESFSGKLRYELLNGKIFYTMKEAKIENWRRGRSDPHRYSRSLVVSMLRFQFFRREVND